LKSADLLYREIIFNRGISRKILSAAPFFAKLRA